MIWFIIEYYITVKCLKNAMFVFIQKLLNRDALQWILHCWTFEWRESDDSRLWLHKLYLVTSQIQRGRLYDSATWPPSLEQPSPAHHQRGQTFCERRCLFVIFSLAVVVVDLVAVLVGDGVVVVAIPSSVPTSQALLPRRSSRCPHLRQHTRLIPHQSWPHPQRSTGSDVRSFVGCHPKETQHFCWFTLVVFTDACSDSAYAGHHLLCPTLSTVLGK